jgi:hypothetical protein
LRLIVLLSAFTEDKQNAEADRIHSESQEVKKFAAILYPECLAPVEFIDYRRVVSNF